MRCAVGRESFFFRSIPSTFSTSGHSKSKLSCTIAAGAVVATWFRVNAGIQFITRICGLQFRAQVFNFFARCFGRTRVCMRRCKSDHKCVCWCICVFPLRAAHKLALSKLSPCFDQLSHALTSINNFFKFFLSVYCWMHLLLARSFGCF